MPRFLVLARHARREQLAILCEVGMIWGRQVDDQVGQAIADVRLYGDESHE
ncbi:hypothetical protein D3C86_2009280 [compost metagenome]